MSHNYNIRRHISYRWKEYLIDDNVMSIKTNIRNGLHPQY
jgi:hypothetical protein